uniref:Uncharacterized protein n=1 Tax=Picea glauca TaxID=3330 RepID=A0A101LYT0_PICGL|nr:hypothetical protein ABT39_MTgene5870 [Picea glauca]QHR92105.1 hypothetical protein Q903MT_gene6141 [Picea sitchensis]
MVNIVLFPTTLIANTQVASLRLCLARFPLASIVIVDPSLSCFALKIASFPPLDGLAHMMDAR